MKFKKSFLCPAPYKCEVNVTEYGTAKCPRCLRFFKWEAVQELLLCQGRFELGENETLELWN